VSGSLRAFAVLAGEAFRDGLRRRLALAVAVILVLGLASAQSCTQIGGGELAIDGRAVDPQVVGGFLAPLLFSLQALSVLAIAGLVAADHLARPLAEGSAPLWLARPVSRRVFAAARLAGALAVALAAGALLLGGTGALLLARQHVALAPALAAAAATALGGVAVASLAMAASLVVGRAAVVLLVLLGLAFVTAANGVGLVSELVHPEVEIGGVVGAVDRYGPPLFRSIAAAVAAWNPHVDAGDVYPQAMARLALWSVAGVALLLALFQRREIDG
jgi:ABC-type transport system involved in multi-copper enzyme maturation permease subunit